MLRSYLAGSIASGVPLVNKTLSLSSYEVNIQIQLFQVRTERQAVCVRRSREPVVRVLARRINRGIYGIFFLNFPGASPTLLSRPCVEHDLASGRQVLEAIHVSAAC